MKFPVSKKQQNFGRVLCCSFCLSFGNVKIILNNPSPTSSVSLLPGKDVYFNVIILTLFVYIFQLSTFILFAYVFILISSKKRFFSLPILETRSSVFANKGLCLFSPYIVRTNCSQSIIKHVVAML